MWPNSYVGKSPLTVHRFTRALIPTLALAVLGLLVTTGGMPIPPVRPAVFSMTAPVSGTTGPVEPLVPAAKAWTPAKVATDAPVRLGGSPAVGRVELPYGISLVGAYQMFASQVPGYVPPGSNDSSCSVPSPNTSTAHPLVLVPTGSFLCLNGANAGVVSSAWQSNLTNATTYQNGSTAIQGCAPLPSAGASSCPFFASNRYTTYVSQWVGDVPENTTEFWSPDQTGYAPNDLVFSIELSANGSTPLDTLYELTVDLAGPMAAPYSFYLRTPSTSFSETNLTLTFDLTLAWLTNLTGSSVGISPVVDGYSLVVSELSPCAICLLAFTERGLPPSTTWWVNISGRSPLSSTGASIDTWLANGSYPYTIGVSPVGQQAYRAPEGLSQVNGAPQTVLVAFEQVYGMTFTETGLPADTTWWVNISGRPSLASGGSSTAVLLPNASYRYTIGSADKAYASPAGEAAMNGAPTTVPVPFALVTYSVTFTQTGLPQAKDWSVTLGGVTRHSTGPSITFDEPNASYVYTVGSVPGYLANRSGGLVRVEGAGAVELLTFGPTAKPATFLGLPAAEGYGVLAGTIAVVLVIAGWVALRLRRRRKPMVGPRSGTPGSPSGPIGPR